MERIIGAVLLGVLGVALFAVVTGAFFAWPVMVLWGAVADDFGVQTIGFGTAWQLSALTALLFKSSSGSSSS